MLNCVYALADDQLYQLMLINANTVIDSDSKPSPLESGSRVQVLEILIFNTCFILLSSVMNFIFIFIYKFKLYCRPNFHNCYPHYHQ